jgi:hypothetical protein
VLRPATSIGLVAPLAAGGIEKVGPDLAALERVDEDALEDRLAWDFEPLPAAVEVTVVAPSVTPNWTGVSVDSRCRIDRIFLYHHRCWRHNHGSPNHHSLGDDGSWLLDNDTRSRSIFVRSFSFIPMNFTIRSYCQIGSHCWRGNSQGTCHT